MFQYHISVQKFGAMPQGVSPKMLLFSDLNKNVRGVLKVNLIAEALLGFFWGVFLFLTKIGMSCIVAADTRLDLKLQGWIRASRGELEPPRSRFDALESEFPTMNA